MHQQQDQVPPSQHQQVYLGQQHHNGLHAQQQSVLQQHLHLPAAAADMGQPLHVQPHIHQHLQLLDPQQQSMFYWQLMQSGLAPQGYSTPGQLPQLTSHSQLAAQQPLDDELEADQAPRTANGSSIAALTGNQHHQHHQLQHHQQPTLPQALTAAAMPMHLDPMNLLHHVMQQMHSSGTAPANGQVLAANPAKPSLVPMPPVHPSPTANDDLSQGCSQPTSTAPPQADAYPGLSLGHAMENARLKNREAQKRFRDKQKASISTLQLQVEALTAKLKEAHREIKTLQVENASLRSKLAGASETPAPME